MVGLGKPAQRPLPVNISVQYEWHTDTRTHILSRCCARIRCTHKTELGEAEENRH